MRIEDYPSQEPLSEAGQIFADEVMARGAGVAALDVQYGADPYQSIAIQTPAQPNGAVLAMMHGGGWTSGYKEHLNFAGPCATARGAIYASIGYRLGPRGPFSPRLGGGAEAAARSAPASAPGGRRGTCSPPVWRMPPTPSPGCMTTSPGSAATRGASSSAGIRRAGTTRRCSR